MEYKDINNNEGITYYFGNLLINTYNDFMLKLELFYTKLEQFHTSFGQPKDFKFIIVVNTLANNTFKY